MQTDIRLFTIIISLFAITSCGHENVNENSRTTNNGDSIHSQPNSSQTSSSDIISFPCAIILSPTDKIIDSLKNANEEDFYTVADDIMFYNSIATHYLDSIKFKTINKTSEGNIVFHLSNSKDFVFKLSGQHWGILLFNGKDEPILSDISDFKTEFDNYMKTRL